MIKTTLSINGMHCESCAKLITMELDEDPGVSKATVDYQDRSAVVEYDPKKTTVEKIIDVIVSLGYQAKEI